jgi:transposase
MMIIGVDYHPSFQQIAFLVEETGEYGEQQLNHSDREAERFYRDLKQRGISVRVGMEATGYARWFERLLAELGFELWIGSPAEIKTKRVKKQKTDRKDAQLLLRLMREGTFPRIWIPSPENRDLRQLLWHRHRLVQMRTRIMSQLQALAMNEGWRWKKKLWSEPRRTEFEKLRLGPWASRRRQELLELLDRLNPTIAELTTAVEEEASKRPEVLRLMTHPGVGALTALAYVLIIGNPERFSRGRQIGTYVGMIPSEDSSAGKQRGRPLKTAQTVAGLNFSELKSFLFCLACGVIGWCPFRSCRVRNREAERPHRWNIPAAKPQSRTTIGSRISGPAP